MSKQKNKQQKAKIVLQYLEKKYTPFMKKHYSHKKDYFRALITVLLSQRTREEITIEKSKLLFDKLHLKVNDFLKMSTSRIEQLIKPAGFYRQKAKKIKLICKILKQKYDGKVPKSREQLLELPGIGKKSADVVLNTIKRDVIAVDVHVNVISKRLGLVDKNADYDSIQEGLHNLFKPNERRYVNLGMVLFGRDICLTANPKCNICPFKDFCDSYKHKKHKNLNINK